MNQQQVKNTNNISNIQTEKSAKKGTQEQHSIYIIDLLEQNMKDEQLQEITKKYDKVIDQEKRKDSKGKRGNISIVIFSTKDLAEKTITGLNKANKNMLPKI